MKKKLVNNTTLKITDEEFVKFQRLIENKIGIKFPDNKRSLLESRLCNRIIKLKLRSFGEYFKYLKKNDEEYDYFIDRVTTHTTHFFRENNHFEYLVDKGIDHINKHFNRPKIKILSLGASTGEEIYTLAMLLFKLRLENRIFDYEIHAADISKIALLKAKEGVFKEESLNTVPDMYKNYFIKKDKMIYAKDFLKYNLRYFLLNACNRTQNFPDKYHIVFCRNIFIYFRKNLQQNILDNIMRIILNYGLLFIGHTETLISFDHDFKKIENSIYYRVEEND